MIHFSCPQCNKKWKFPTVKAGKKFSCPTCKQRIQIPSPSTNKTLLGTLVIESGSTEVSTAKHTKGLLTIPLGRTILITLLVCVGAGLLVGGMESSYLYTSWSERPTFDGLEFIFAIAAAKGAGVGLLAGGIAILLFSVLSSKKPPRE